MSIGKKCGIVSYHEKTYGIVSTMEKSCVIKWSGTRCVLMSSPGHGGYRFRFGVLPCCRARGGGPAAPLTNNGECHDHAESGSSGRLDTGKHSVRFPNTLF